MNPVFIKLHKSEQVSFTIRKDEVPYFTIPWHYHQELELTYILQGEGIRFVGDSIESYSTGDLVLVGSNIPHFWQSDKKEFSEKGMDTKAIVLHFLPEFAGVDFIHLPEMRGIKKILELASRGICITGHTAKAVQSLLSELLEASGSRRVITLLLILQCISEGEKDGRLLSSQGFSNVFMHDDKKKLKTVYDYIMNHFSEDITLQEVASVACMSPTAFCRYFKAHTRSTFSQFLNQVRIGYACKLLTEKKMNVTQIAYESGFNSLTSFSIQFKAYTKLTPLKYRAKAPAT